MVCRCRWFFMSVWSWDQPVVSLDFVPAFAKPQCLARLGWLDGDGFQKLKNNGKGILLNLMEVFNAVLWRSCFFRVNHPNLRRKCISKPKGTVRFCKNSFAYSLKQNHFQSLWSSTQHDQLYTWAAVNQPTHSVEPLDGRPPAQVRAPPTVARAGEDHRAAG